MSLAAQVGLGLGQVSLQGPHDLSMRGNRAAEPHGRLADGCKIFTADGLDRSTRAGQKGAGILSPRHGRGCKPGSKRSPVVRL